MGQLSPRRRFEARQERVPGIVQLEAFAQNIPPGRKLENPYKHLLLFSRGTACPIGRAYAEKTKALILQLVSAKNSLATAEAPHSMAIGSEPQINFALGVVLGYEDAEPHKLPVGIFQPYGFCVIAARFISSPIDGTIDNKRFAAFLNDRPARTQHGNAKHDQQKLHMFADARSTTCSVHRLGFPVHVAFGSSRQVSAPGSPP
jgi:hypothetical protein